MNKHTVVYRWWYAHDDYFSDFYEGRQQSETKKFHGQYKEQIFMQSHHISRIFPMIVQKSINFERCCRRRFGVSVSWEMTIIYAIVWPAIKDSRKTSKFVASGNTFWFVRSQLKIFFLCYSDNFVNAKLQESGKWEITTWKPPNKTLKNIQV